MGEIFVLLAVTGALAILFTIPMTAKAGGVARHVKWVGRMALFAGVLWQLADYLETGLLRYSSLAVAAGVALVYGAQMVREHQRRKEES